MKLNQIHNINCFEGMQQLDDNSIDALVTDPPYGISFMGKKWDYEIPSVGIWQECLRVLKPGGMLLSFAGTRTQHRMACNIEDAGFEIRDMIAWVYGTGFPKSLNIGKAIAKYKNEPILKGKLKFKGGSQLGLINDDSWKPKDVYEEKVNNEWEGWGTALKPAFEPITVARKPLSEKTVAKNVLKWGTGGINVDGCRVPTNQNIDDMSRKVKRNKRVTKTWEKGSGFKNETNSLTGVLPKGRFPANFIHDGSEEVLKVFPVSKNQGHWAKTKVKGFGEFGGGKSTYEGVGHKDKKGGSTSRFFYCAKASKVERNAGCKNTHTTIKPIKLMEYLVKLVSKKSAIILDPFVGSGTTAIACMRLQRNFIGFEFDKDYCKIANARLKHQKKQMKLEGFK